MEMTPLVEVVIGDHCSAVVVVELMPAECSLDKGKNNG
jgi:hypothetical protein